MKKISISRLIVYVIAYLFAFIWLFPVLWMIISAFKPVGTPVSDISKLLSPPFVMGNFNLIAQKAPVWKWTLNSLFVAVVVTGGTLVVTSLAAYALSKLNFKGKTIVTMVISLGLMIPIESIVIPLYQTMADLNMLNSYISLISPSLAAPIGVLIMKRFYDDIPNELVEAAHIDGAGIFLRWFHICLPLSKSSMAAVGIFTFTNSWNNFLWPFLSITSEKMMTLPVGIPQFTSANLSEFVLPMTVSVVASVPVLIIFVIFQKQIIKGIAMTGIKG